MARYPSAPPEGTRLPAQIPSQQVWCSRQTRTVSSPIGHTPGVRDATARRLSRLHAILYRTTRGHVGTRLVSNDMLLLTTRGRTSGQPHTVPLLYLQDGETVVVAASWGGRDYHPDWYLNLIAQPVAAVNLRRTSRHIIARNAGSEERTIW